MRAVKYAYEPITKDFDILFYYFKFEKNRSKEVKTFTKLDLEEVNLTKNLNILPDPMKSLIWMHEKDFIDEDEEDMHVIRSRSYGRKKNKSNLFTNRNVSFTIDELGKDSRFSYNTLKDKIMERLRPKLKKKKNDFFSDLAMISKASKEKYLRLRNRGGVRSVARSNKSDNVFDKFNMSTKQSISKAVVFLKKKHHKSVEIQLRSTFCSGGIGDFEDSRQARIMMNTTGGRFLKARRNRISRSFDQRVSQTGNHFSKKRGRLRLDKIENREKNWRV